MVKPALSESQRMRLENVFREAFGRELTSEERKFLGLSVVMSPPDEDEAATSLLKPDVDDDEMDGPIAKKASA
jgi:hypothetical protein